MTALSQHFSNNVLRGDELGEFMGDELFLNLQIGEGCESDAVIPAEPAVEAVYEVDSNPVYCPWGLGEQRKTRQYTVAYRGPFGLELLLVLFQSGPGFVPDLIKTCHSSLTNLPKRFRRLAITGQRFKTSRRASLHQTSNKPVPFR